MKNEEIVKALREHAEWAQANEWETPITLSDDLAAAADRIVAAEEFALILKKEIEKLRAQNRQLMLERNYVMSIIADVRKGGKTWMCQYCAHCKGIVSGMADCDSKKPCVMPYGQFELNRPKPPEEIDMDHEAAEQLRQLCQGCDLDRLEELAEADKDGQLVVLPCKVGDKLYRVFDGNISEHEVQNMKYFARQRRLGIDMTPFFPDAGRFIGKTVFLTREEAEKSLEAMKDAK